MSAQAEVEEVEATAGCLHLAWSSGGVDAVFGSGGVGQESDLRVRMASTAGVKCDVTAE